MYRQVQNIGSSNTIRNSFGVPQVRNMRFLIPYLRHFADFFCLIATRVLCLTALFILNLFRVNFLIISKLIFYKKIYIVLKAQNPLVTENLKQLNYFKPRLTLLIILHAIPVI